MAADTIEQQGGSGNDISIIGRRDGGVRVGDNEINVTNGGLGQSTVCSGRDGSTVAKEELTEGCGRVGISTRKVSHDLCTITRGQSGRKVGKRRDPKTVRARVDELACKRHHGFRAQWRIESVRERGLVPKLVQICRMASLHRGDRGRGRQEVARETRGGSQIGRDTRVL